MAGSTQAYKDVLAAVGANVLRYRARRGYTQARVAEAAEVAVEHLRGVEGGYRAPSLRLLTTIAEILGCTVVDLVRPGPTVARNPGRPRTKKQSE